MKTLVVGLILLIGIPMVLLLSGALYVVNETQQVVITQFGEPVGTPIDSPGIRWKIPFGVQQAVFFEKRFLEWDGERDQVTTKDKRFIWADTYARWRIVDPLLFFQRLGNERGAQSRLDDILDGATRTTIAKHDLIEVVRTSNREFARPEDILAGQEVQQGVEIEFGRDALATEVLHSAAERVGDLGIEILDFRFKRINYVPEVREKVYARMISERQRIAEQFRSEGAGESARINGEKERELKRISSEAYRTAQEIKGRADAKAADIYAKAYNKDPEFYRFVKTMEVYASVLDQETVLLLSTDGDLFRYIEKAR